FLTANSSSAIRVGRSPGRVPLANERASEPTRAEWGNGDPASERAGESEGRSPSDRRGPKMSDYTRREFGATLAAGAALPSAFGQTQPSRPSAGSLTDVPGVTVGHFTDTRRPTGCTAILFESAAAA